MNFSRSSVFGIGSATVLTALVTTSAAAQFAFDPAVNYGVGQRPAGTAAGDFDGDGDADLAITNDGTGTQDRIDIMLNNGDGTFVFGGSVFLANSSSPGELIAADLDGDSDIDLAVILEDFNQVQTVTNDGAGNFTPGATATVGSNAQGIDSADADGDGDVDIVVANRDSNTATVLMNQGNGTFTSTTLAAGQEPRGAAFGDIDGDGDMDVVVTNHDDRTLSLFQNTGAAFSGVGTLSVGAQRRPEGVTSVDLNNDGLDDIAAASNGVGFESASVFLATGGGAFSGPVHYATNGVDTSRIAHADFDCDGNVDLITGNAESGNLSAFANSGTGTFGAAQLVSVGANPEQIVAIDLDGDTDADIAVANRDSNNVSVIINNCALAEVADLTDLTMRFGSLLAGGLPEMVDSDNVTAQMRSQFGFSATEANIIEAHIGATTNMSGPSTVGISLESRINQPGGVLKVYARNWGTGNLVLLDTSAIGAVETIVTLDGLSAADYVRADGRIELAVRYSAVATPSPFGFDAFIDQLQITVE